jgi:hypothetical protein
MRQTIEVSAKSSGVLLYVVTVEQPRAGLMCILKDRPGWGYAESIEKKTSQENCVRRIVVGLPIMSFGLTWEHHHILVPDEHTVLEGTVILSYT